MNRKSAFTVLAIGGVALSVATLAHATGPRHGGMGHFPPSAEELFEKADANQDGQITAEELQSLRKDRFKTKDTDGDGKISRDEAIAAMSARIEQRVTYMFERMDENKDGFISEDERPDRSERRSRMMMAWLDEDGDGVITMEEAKAAEKMRGEFHRKGDFPHKREKCD